MGKTSTSRSSNTSELSGSRSEKRRDDETPSKSRSRTESTTSSSTRRKSSRRDDPERELGYQATGAPLSSFHENATDSVITPSGASSYATAYSREPSMASRSAYNERSESLVERGSKSDRKEGRKDSKRESRGQSSRGLEDDDDDEQRGTPRRDSEKRRRDSRKSDKSKRESTQTPDNPNKASLVENQFPGEFPSTFTQPYFPADRRPSGLAADYYGDHGESVAYQPGVRPLPPSIITSADQAHLYEPTVEAKPPPEPSSLGQLGAAASFYGEVNDKGDSSPITTPSRPPRRPRLESGVQSNTGASPRSTPGPDVSRPTSQRQPGGSIVNMGSVTMAPAVGAAAEYYGGQIPMTTPIDPSPGNSGSRPMGSSPNMNESSSRPSGSSIRPGSSSAVPFLGAATAAGLVGVAATAYHESHNHQDQQTSVPQGADSSFVLGQAQSAFPDMQQRHRHKRRGPIGKFVDWFRDPQGVAEFEQYCQITGICKYCFDPNSSPLDAPRRHQYRVRRSSGSRYGSNTRVDKLTRYSSDEEKRRRSTIKKAALDGVAALGAARIGEAVYKQKYDFDDTHSVKSGVPANRSRVSFIEGEESSVRRNKKYSSSEEQQLSQRKSSRSNRDNEKYQSRSSRRQDSNGGDSGVSRGAALAGMAAAGVAAEVIDQKQRRKRSRSPKKGYYSKRVSPKHSYVDLTNTNSGSFGFGSFFSSPSANARKGKKQKGLFNFANDSSSSSDADLAFGEGTVRRKKEQANNTTKNDGNATVAILGLAATGAALAAESNRREEKGKRKTDVVVVKENRPSRRSNKTSSKTRDSSSDSVREDVWEDASDNESDVESALAYGGRLSARQSKESLVSNDGTAKWNWRWNKKEDERRKKSTRIVESKITESSNNPFGGFEGMSQHTPENTSTPNLPPMKYVDPVPTSDPTIFDARQISRVSGVSPHPNSPPVRAKSDSVPLQQPQPSMPISPVVYETRTPVSKPFSGSPSNTAAFDREVSQPVVFDPSTEVTVSSKDRKSRRRRDSSPAALPSRDGVKFDLTEEQLEQERREERRRVRRAERDRRRTEETPEADNIVPVAGDKDIGYTEPRSKERRKSVDDRATREAEIDRELKQLQEEYRKQSEDRARRTKQAEVAVTTAAVVGAGVMAISSRKDREPRSDEDEEKRELSRSQRKTSSSRAEDSDVSPKESQQKRIARMAAQRVKNSKSPVYEDYGTFFVPPELAEHVKEHNSQAEHRDDTVAHVVELIPGAMKKNDPFDPFLYRPFGLEPDDDPSLHPWPVPQLELIEPTPPPSRPQSALGMREVIPDVVSEVTSKEVPKVIPEVIHEETVKSEEKVDLPKRNRANSVTWGEHETIVYEVQTPEWERGEFTISNTPQEQANEGKSQTKKPMPYIPPVEKMTREQLEHLDLGKPLADFPPGVEEQPRSPEAILSPTIEVREPDSSKMKELEDLHHSLEFAATLPAAVKATDFDPAIMVDEHAYYASGSTPENDHDRSFYQSPFVETVSDIGVMPDYSNVPLRSSGFVEAAEIPEISKPDVSISRELPALSTTEIKDETKIEQDQIGSRASRSEERRRERAASKSQTDTSIPVSTPLDMTVAKETESTSVASNFSVFDYLVEGSKESIPTASVFGLAALGAKEAAEMARKRREKASTGASRNVIAQSDDTESFKKLKRAQTLDSSKFEAAIETPKSKSSYASDPEDWEKSTKKSKKSKKSSSRRDLDTAAKPSMESTSVVSIPNGDNFYENKKSKRKSKRDSEVFEDDSKSIASSSATFNENEEGEDRKKSSRKSKRNSDPYDDDTRSVNSSRTESKSEKDSKQKGKEKEKEKKSGGIFGFFSSSKSDVSRSSDKRISSSVNSEARDESSRRKSKSKDKSRDDASEVRQNRSNSQASVQKPSHEESVDDDGFVSAEEDTVKNGASHGSDDELPESSFLAIRPEMPTVTDGASGLDAGRDHDVVPISSPLGDERMPLSNSKEPSSLTTQTERDLDLTAVPADNTRLDISRPLVAQEDFKSLQPAEDQLPTSEEPKDATLNVVGTPTSGRSRSMSPDGISTTFDVAPGSQSQPSSPVLEHHRPGRLSTFRSSNMPSSPVATSSPTAVPLPFRRMPVTPGAIRTGSFGSPASPISPLTTPRTRQGRPMSTEIRSKDIRPLYLVEKHGSAKQAAQEIEETYPSLPSSRTTSTHPSMENLRGDDVEEYFPSERITPEMFSNRRQSQSYWRDDRPRSPDYLDSGQATPTATSPGIVTKEKPKYEFHSPSELLQDPTLHQDVAPEHEEPLASPLPSVASSDRDDADFMSARQSRATSPVQDHSHYDNVWTGVGVGALVGAGVIAATSLQHRDEREEHSKEPLESDNHRVRDLVAVAKEPSNTKILDDEQMKSLPSPETSLSQRSSPRDLSPKIEATRNIGGYLPTANALEGSLKEESALGVDYTAHVAPIPLISVNDTTSGSRPLLAQESRNESFAPSIEEVNVTENNLSAFEEAFTRAASARGFKEGVTRDEAVEEFLPKRDNAPFIEHGALTPIGELSKGPSPIDTPLAAEMVPREELTSNTKKDKKKEKKSKKSSKSKQSFEQDSIMIDNIGEESQPRESAISTENAETLPVDGPDDTDLERALQGKAAFGNDFETNTKVSENVENSVETRQLSEVVPVEDLEESFWTPSSKKDKKKKKSQISSNFATNSEYFADPPPEKAQIPDEEEQGLFYNPPLTEPKKSKKKSKVTSWTGDDVDPVITEISSQRDIVAEPEQIESDKNDPTVIEQSEAPLVIEPATGEPLLQEDFKAVDFSEAKSKKEKKSKKKKKGQEWEEITETPVPAFDTLTTEEESRHHPIEAATDEPLLREDLKAVDSSEAKSKKEKKSIKKKKDQDWEETTQSPVPTIDTSTTGEEFRHHSIEAATESLPSLDPDKTSPLPIESNISQDDQVDQPQIDADSKREQDGTDEFFAMPKKNKNKKSKKRSSAMDDSLETPILTEESVETKEDPPKTSTRQIVEDLTPGTLAAAAIALVSEPSTSTPAEVDDDVYPISSKKKKKEKGKRKSIAWADEAPSTPATQDVVDPTAIDGSDKLEESTTQQLEQGATFTEEVTAEPEEEISTLARDVTETEQGTTLSEPASAISNVKEVSNHVARSEPADAPDEFSWISGSQKKTKKDKKKLTSLIATKEPEPVFEQAEKSSADGSNLIEEDEWALDSKNDKKGKKRDKKRKSISFQDVEPTPVPEQVDEVSSAFQSNVSDEIENDRGLLDHHERFKTLDRMESGRVEPEHDAEVQQPIHESVPHKAMGQVYFDIPVEHGVEEESEQVVETEPEHVEQKPEHIEQELEYIEKEPEHVEKELEHVEKELEHVEQEPEYVEQEPEHVEQESENVEREPEHGDFRQDTAADSLIKPSVGKDRGFDDEKLTMTTDVHGSAIELTQPATSTLGSEDVPISSVQRDLVAEGVVFASQPFTEAATVEQSTPNETRHEAEQEEDWGFPTKTKKDKKKKKSKPTLDTPAPEGDSRQLASQPSDVATVSDVKELSIDEPTEPWLDAEEVKEVEPADTLDQSFTTKKSKKDKKKKGRQSIIDSSAPADVAVAEIISTMDEEPQRDIVPESLDREISDTLSKEPEDVSPEAVQTLEERAEDDSVFPLARSKKGKKKKHLSTISTLLPSQQNIEEKALEFEATETPAISTEDGALESVHRVESTVPKEHISTVPAPVEQNDTRGEIDGQDIHASTLSEDIVIPDTDVQPPAQLTADGAMESVHRVESTVPEEHLSTTPTPAEQNETRDDIDVQGIHASTLSEDIVIPDTDFRPPAQLTAEEHEASGMPEDEPMKQSWAFPIKKSKKDKKKKKESVVEEMKGLSTTTAAPFNESVPELDETRLAVKVDEQPKEQSPIEKETLVAAKSFDEPLEQIWDVPVKKSKKDKKKQRQLTMDETNDALIASNIPSEEVHPELRSSHRDIQRAEEVGEGRHPEEAPPTPTLETEEVVEDTFGNFSKKTKKDKKKRQSVVDDVRDISAKTPTPAEEFRPEADSHQDKMEVDEELRVLPQTKEETTGLATPVNEVEEDSWNSPLKKSKKDKKDKKKKRQSAFDFEDPLPQETKADVPAVREPALSAKEQDFDKDIEPNAQSEDIVMREAMEEGSEENTMPRTFEEPLIDDTEVFGKKRLKKDKKKRQSTTDYFDPPEAVITSEPAEARDFSEKPMEVDNNDFQPPTPHENRDLTSVNEDESAPMTPAVEEDGTMWSTDKKKMKKDKKKRLALIESENPEDSPTSTLSEQKHVELGRDLPSDQQDVSVPTILAEQQDELWPTNKTKKEKKKKKKNILAWTQEDDISTETTPPAIGHEISLPEALATDPTPHDVEASNTGLDRHIEHVEAPEERIYDTIQLPVAMPGAFGDGEVFTEPHHDVHAFHDVVQPEAVIRDSSAEAMLPETVPDMTPEHGQQEITNAVSPHNTVGLEANQLGAITSETAQPLESNLPETIQQNLPQQEQTRDIVDSPGKNEADEEWGFPTKSKKTKKDKKTRKSILASDEAMETESRNEPVPITESFDALITPPNTRIVEAEIPSQSRDMPEPMHVSEHPAETSTREISPDTKKLEQRSYSPGQSSSLKEKKRRRRSPITWAGEEPPDLPRSRSATPPKDHDDMMDTALSVAAGLGLAGAATAAAQTSKSDLVKVQNEHQHEAKALKGGPSWSFGNIGLQPTSSQQGINRDSGVQFADSPTVSREVTESARDSGYVPSPIPPSGWHDPVTGVTRAPRPLSPTSSSEDVREIRRTITPENLAEEKSSILHESPETHYPPPTLETPKRQPTPVDSTTKDRSSALFDSSPSIRTDPHGATPKLQTKQLLEPVSDIHRSPSIHGHHHSREELRAITSSHSSRRQLEPEERSSGQIPRESATRDEEYSTLSPRRSPESFERSLPSPTRAPLHTIQEHALETSPSNRRQRDFDDAGVSERGSRSLHRKKSERSLGKAAAVSVGSAAIGESLTSASSREVQPSRTKSLGKSKSQSTSSKQLRRDTTFDPPEFASSSSHDPANERGRGTARDMADFYDGYGEHPGSPMSPTRPPSIRKRQSMQQIKDLETRLDQLANENRTLVEAKILAERHLQDIHIEQSRGDFASKDALRAANLQLRQKDESIENLRESLDRLQQEVERLTEVNRELTVTQENLHSEHEERYSVLQDQHDEAHHQLQDSSRELQTLRSQHEELSTGMEDIVRQEIDTALAEKNAEIDRLYGELDEAKDKIRELQQQILSNPADDVLVVRDEDYFENACQQLCTYVQQWVLRFSKFSDTRVCRLINEVRDENVVDRFENAILDGSDVDNYLGDRVKRRDVFMSVVMTMIWEYIFTRYLFGLDRDQRQKLKQLEKNLSEVGPPSAVHHWRAMTLTLLAKRKVFEKQRGDDTEAVAMEIFDALSKFLPPPSSLGKQIQDSLRNVTRAAVSLSIEMRTQRAEYIMLPPLQPEYDTNGDLVRNVFFNAALMNERSGDTVSNEDLEAQQAAVRMVLFPLVVKKGTDMGEGEEEIVVCPAQVLVAKSGKDKKASRVISADRMSIDQANLKAASVHSFNAPSVVDMGGANMI